MSKPTHKHKFKDEVGVSGLVFKGGSMGQGTTVPNHYDIDLVLYSKQWREKITEVIEREEQRGRGRRNGN